MMGNQQLTGLQMTSVEKSIIGTGIGLGIALLAWNLLVAYDTKGQLTKLLTSQEYDRRDIDRAGASVEQVKIDVRNIADRVGALERRR